jgi:hypothetical protein
MIAKEFHYLLYSAMDIVHIYFEIVLDAKSVFYTVLGRGFSYTNRMFLSSHLSYKITTSIITVNIPRTLPSVEVT